MWRARRGEEGKEGRQGGAEDRLPFPVASLESMVGSTHCSPCWAALPAWGLARGRTRHPGFGKEVEGWGPGLPGTGPTIFESRSRGRGQRVASF